MHPTVLLPHYNLYTYFDLTSVRSYRPVFWKLKHHVCNPSDNPHPTLHNRCILLHIKKEGTLDVTHPTSVHSKVMEVNYLWSKVSKLSRSLDEFCSHPVILKGFSTTSVWGLPGEGFLWVTFLLSCHNSSNFLYLLVCSYDIIVTEYK